MFTGITQSMSPIVAIERRNGGARVRIKKPAGWTLSVGQSVSVDGICSTVVRKTPGYFEVEYMPETLSKTTAASFERGAVVNLERSLTFKSFIDGHVVQGHIDGRGRVAGLHARGSSREYTIDVPRSLTRFIVPQGSIALNGVSLTIASVRKHTCTVALIPFTLQHTNLGTLKKDDLLNIETDILARHIVAAYTGSGTVRRDAEKRVQKKNSSS